MRRSAVILVASLAVAVSACGQGGRSAPGSAATTPADASAGAAGPTASAGGPTVIPVIITQQAVVGANRFVFSFLDPATNLPAATPDRTASVAFIAPGETDPGAATPATFVWAIAGSRGVYVAPADFPSAGDWKAVFVTEVSGRGPEAIAVAFQVADHGVTVGVGQPAPASKTPTLADVSGDVRRLSTDRNPDPAFYRVSVADALARRSAFVLAFATPALCQSAQCGPTLDLVKAVSKTAPASVAFINVEPYQLTFTEGRLQPVLDASGNLQPVAAVNEWGILTEPWVFTVDRTGIVRGSFEGVISEAELEAAIAGIAGS